MARKLEWIRLAAIHPGGVRSIIQKVEGKSQAKPTRNPRLNLRLAFLLTSEMSKIAIPRKEQGQKPQGGTEAAIRRPATKGFKSEDLDKKVFNFFRTFLSLKLQLRFLNGHKQVCQLRSGKNPQLTIQVPRLLISQ